MKERDKLSQIVYDNASTYGVKDLKGNKWRTFGKSKVTTGKNPFGGNDAIKVDVNNSIWLDVPTTLPTNISKFTFCGWMYHSSWSAANNVLQWNDTNNTAFSLAIIKSKPAFAKYALTYITFGSCIELNKWYYYEVTVNGKNVSLFINGKYIGSTNLSHSNGSYDLTKKPTNTGYGLWTVDNVGRYYVNGYMYDMCILNGIWHTSNYNPPTQKLIFDRKSLITSKISINLSNKSKVKGFTINGIQPANTNRKVAFKVDNKWNKLATEGALSPLPTQAITSDSVLAEGNTVAELTALTNVPALAGKLVYPAFALYASENATVMPTIGMTVKAEIDTTVDVYTKTAYSQEFVLHNKRDVLVKSISVDSNTKGNGKVTLKARYATFDGTAITDEGAEQTEKWSDYVDLLSVINVKCHKLQIKADYQVSITDGSDSATLNDVIITYAKDVVAKADGTTDLVTLTEQFTNDLTYVHAYIKHKELIDADLKAYVRLQKTPQKADFKLIGYGTGARKTYKVTDSGINQDSLMVYVNGKAVYDFDFNTETSEITLVADVDVPINATYEFGWELFNYVEMQKVVSQINDSGAYTTEYAYTIPAHDGEYTVTAIKYELIRPEGKVTNDVIGVGTGKRQIIQLPHFARKETISCNGKWSYDYDSKRLTVIAPADTDIVISYDWIAENPVVYGVMAGWAD